ncbi:MAG: M4 family metallopeptidase, partial [Ferruginibacter sp.]
MCNHHEFNPVQCILPPYIGDKLSANNNKKIAQRAVKNLVETIKLRAKREFVAGLTESQIILLEPRGAKKKAAKLNMQVYDMKHGRDPSAAQLVWNNGKVIKTLDKTGKNVVLAGTATSDLYYSIFGRNSIDGLGFLLKHYIHYFNKYNNAMWDGSQMFYGDGDGIIFGDFTIDPDIIGHELTHGVTQYESNLEYHNQSGALNESLSDVFGIMVKQRLLNQDVKASKWLIGENVLL